MRQFLKSTLILTSLLLSTSCSRNSSSIGQGGKSLVCNISYSASLGGRVEGEVNQTVDFKGSTSEVRAIPNEGYYFVGWSDGLTDPNRYEEMVLTDYSLEALFSLESNRPYATVSYVAINGTIVGESVQTVKKGSKASPIRGISNYNFSSSFSWNDGFESRYREDIITEDVTYIITFSRETSDTPMLVIDTGGIPITSKEEYIPATYHLIGADHFNFSDVTGRVRGRGNSTWKVAKKSYKVKFDEKVDLLGLGEAKTWVLLANYQDPSMIRNYGIFDLSRRLGMEYTVDSTPVEVFLNNNFLGLYQLTEQVEINKERVLDTKEDESGEVDVNYLLEGDYWCQIEGGVEGVDYFTAGDTGTPFVIKSPDTEKETFTKAQFDFIDNYMDQIANAYRNKDRETLESLVDIDSLINFYLLQEIYQNSDCSYSSLYFYKKAGGKLYAGPIWDFDRSSGNNTYDYNTIVAKNTHFLYSMLFMNQNLASRVLDRYNEIESLLEMNISSTANIYSTYKQSFDRHNVRWPHQYDTFVPNFSDEIMKYTTVEGQVKYYQDFMTRRIKWLSENKSTVFKAEEEN